MLPLFDRNPTHHRAVATLALIALNVVVFFFIQARSGVEFVELPNGTSVPIDSEFRFALEYAAIPCELTEGRALDLVEIQDFAAGTADTCNTSDGPQLFADKNVWLAALTSMFLHGDLAHLCFNMLFLWIFGNNIEDHVGPMKYVAFYLLAGIAGLGTHVALQPDSTVPLVGASGAVAGVMGAYLIWFPRAPIRTFIFLFLIDVRALWWLTAWFVLQFFTGQDSGVAWAAHVGGFAFGVGAAMLVRHIRPLCRWAWRDPWRQRAYRGWDLSGGMGRPEPPRFGGKVW